MVRGDAVTVMCSVAAELLPHELTAVTFIFPETLIVFIEMESVDDDPAQPPGNVQEYEVAPLTGTVLYIEEPPEQTVESPNMETGALGALLIAIAIV
jgi:hypothetical protein